MLKPKSQVVIKCTEKDSLEISIIKREGIDPIQTSLESIESNQGISVFDKEQSWQIVYWGAHYEKVDVLEEVVRLVEEGSDHGIAYLVVDGKTFSTFEGAKRERVNSRREIKDIEITLK